MFKPSVTYTHIVEQFHWQSYRINRVHLTKDYAAAALYWEIKKWTDGEYGFLLKLVKTTDTNVTEASTQDLDIPCQP